MPVSRRPHSSLPLTLVALVSIVGGLAACDRLGRAPTAPSGPPSAEEVLPQWSPYVGVHVNGSVLPAYRDSLLALQRAGRLNGVRMEIRPNEQGGPVIDAISRLGVEVLGLVSNEYLLDSNIEGALDHIFSAYPDIRHFQIGNEITTILPASGPQVSIEHYAALFQRAYNHVNAKYPGRAILVTQSALGSGLRGPTELETLARLALSRMDPDKVIVAINAYDPDAVSQYRGLLGGALRSFRVWVTESGVANPEGHTQFVRDKYPLLRRYLRAERVYWYVLWGGDEGVDTEFSLIKSPMAFPSYWKSPLFNLLVNGQ